jgi:ketosteroid isomerase-like protein
MLALQNVALVKDVMESLMRGNPAPLLAAISEDAVIEAVIPKGTPISGSFRGRDGYMQYLTALGEVMEILDMQISDYTASEKNVVVLGFERARVKRTGKLLECETATVVSVEQGKITKLLALADMSAIVDAYCQPQAS